MSIPNFREKGRNDLSLFEYLKLNINEKIDYKARTGKRVIDIVDENDPELLDGDYIKTQELKDILRVRCRQTITKLARKNLLGKPRKEGKYNLYPVKDVNAYLLRKARTYSRADFLPHLREYYYFSNQYFQKKDESWGSLNGEIVPGDNRRFSLKETARIFMEFRHRKEVIENWKSFKNLFEENRELSKSCNSFGHVYGPDLKKKCRCDRIRTSKSAPHWMFHPLDAKRFFSEEKKKIEKKKRIAEENLSLSEIASQRNIKHITVFHRASVAEEKGLIRPVRIKHAMYIPPEQVDKLFGEEMKGYTNYVPGIRKFTEREKIANRGEKIEYIPGVAKRRLIAYAKKGDEASKKVLFMFGENLVEEVAKNNLWGYDIQERKTMAHTALWEMLAEGDYSVFEEKGEEILIQCMKDRRKEERAGWISLDKRCSNAEGGKTSTLGDLVEPVRVF